MDAVKLILAVLTAAFVGWNILYLISSKSHKLYFCEKLFISYGLGFGAISLEMFLLFFLNMKFDFIEILAPWAVLFVFNIVRNISSKSRVEDKAIPAEGYNNKALSVFLIIGIAFEVLYAIFRALIKPIEAYDAIATFAIKSKIFYLAGSIPHDYFYNIGLLFPHVDYPLNIPLSETFIYLFLGGINEQLVKIIFPLYFVAILGILYFAIRRFSSRTYALIFTFILATIPQYSNFATNAYVDMPLSYYYLAGTLFLLYWFKDTKSSEFLYISSLMTALAAWTKNEGLVYCLINAVILAAFLLLNRSSLKKKDILNGIGYAAVIAVIILPWLFIRKTAHLVNSDFGIPAIGQFDIVKHCQRIGPMFYEFQRQIFGPKKWNIFWVIFIVALVLYRKKALSKYQVYVTATLLLIIGAYILAYIAAQTEMPTLWSRFMIHFIPISVYLASVLFKDDIKI